MPCFLMFRANDLPIDSVLLMTTVTIQKQKGSDCFGHKHICFKTIFKTKYRSNVFTMQKNCQVNEVQQNLPVKKKKIAS